ncbi:hypothetical protein EDB86DRAFT_2835659 [Lactarius hatsudake]|nr:hypothetical protein EDB86DRAFT_2835659 [Lactarius hatsudake]
MVAIVAVAVHASLEEKAYGSEFNADAYEDSYNIHVATLREIQDNNRLAYQHLMSDLYKLVTPKTHVRDCNATTGVLSMTCTMSKSTGSERRKSIKTQFEDAQVSLGFPGTKDNSRSTRLKRKGEQKVDSSARASRGSFVRQRRCGITQEVKSTVQAR